MDWSFADVFSTHVEMFLSFCRMRYRFLSFLHARGDVSSEFLQIGSTEEFSPRTWRCFQCSWYSSGPCWVFSTHVEMFLSTRILAFLLLRFLHARGDVSQETLNLGSGDLFSPRTWRCFPMTALSASLTSVFSTHVEMFLLVSICTRLTHCFLHACGDDS